MEELEKVIKAFDEAKELVWTDDDEYTVGYNNGLEAGKNIALTLLKEQKIAMKPKNIDKVGGNCPVCGLRMARNHKYCYQCGQEMDWK